MTMRDTNLSTMNSSVSTQPEKGIILRISGKIFGAAMITWMLVGIMLVPTTAVKAQRVNREALTRLSKGSAGAPVTLAPARPNQKADARKAASSIKEAGLNGPPKKLAIVGTWLE